ncbi:MAG: class C sortase [Pseudoclavibacter sp.]
MAKRATARHGAPGQKRRWRLNRLSLLVAAIALVGLVALLYPTAASWVSQYNQSKIVEQEQGGVDTQTAAARKAALAAAGKYNDALNSGAVYTADDNVPTSTAGKKLHSEYSRLLDAGPDGLMGRIQIPSIQLDLPIYHGTSDATLLRGIGHLEGTSLPVGGQGTHAVLTGHRGLATATMFTYLDRVKVGDEFTISVFGKVLTYRVVTTKVVDPDQTRSLAPVAGKDLVTLVTCTPLGINTQRIFVTGQRVIPTPTGAKDAARKKPTIPSFPWWLLILAGGTALIGVYVWRSGYPPRPRAAAQKQVTPEE